MRKTAGGGAVMSRPLATCGDAGAPPLLAGGAGMKKLFVLAGGVMEVSSGGSIADDEQRLKLSVSMLTDRLLCKA